MRGDLFKSDRSRWMSWTQTQQQCGPNVVIRARRQATMWSGCLVLGGHQHITVSLVMGLPEVAPYHWVLWWIMKRWWVVQIVSNGCHGTKNITRHINKSKSSSDYVLYSACSKLSIHFMIMTLSIWMAGRKSPWPVMVALRQQCRAHSRLSLSQADSHSSSLGPVWETLLNSTLCLWH